MEQLPKIVQQRLQGTQSPGVHPDPDLLAAFAEKSLHDRERTLVLQHLADCADCRDVISLATPEIEPTLAPRGTRSPWLSWPMLRWGALAACVIVVSAAVTLHYEQRQGVEPSLAEKSVPAPAAPPVASEVSKPSEQKLAAKIAPPSPFPSDRDFGTPAGKLARQREKGADAGMTAGAQGPASPVLALNESENSRGSTGKRLANSDAMKSADMPASQPTGRLMAAPPVPPSPPKAADAEPEAIGAQNTTRNDTLDYAARTSTHSVAVLNSTAPAVETAQSAERTAKDEATKKGSNNKEMLRKEAQVAQAGAASARSVGDLKQDSVAGQRAQTVSGAYDPLSRRSKTAPQWALRTDGVLQRSFDSGQTWQPIPVASHVVFRALAANDSDVWVGGAAGALYHSSDAGQHWIQVKPVADGKPLTADITGIDFSDAQHGRLTTADQENWITSDAGGTWHVH